MEAKAAILSRLRNALQVSGDDSTRKTAVASRLKFAPNGVIPQRGQGSSKEQVALFVKMAEKFAATVSHVKSPMQIPEEVTAYLRLRNLPASVRMGGDPRLTAMPWASQKNLEVKSGQSDGRDEACLSHAFGAVAETGTLVVTSGAENPTTLNFLPEHHIVILNAADIRGDYESVMSDIRTAYGKGHMPRTVNMITGPSRSGDIEQTILLGAHGPRALHIFVVG